VHSTLRGPERRARGRGDCTHQAELKPEVTVMRLEGSVILEQAVGVSEERAAEDRHAVVLRDGRRRESRTTRGCSRRCRAFARPLLSLKRYSVRRTPSTRGSGLTGSASPRLAVV
jgi:hypothetical protein